jgi:hypothetical protein
VRDQRLDDESLLSHCLIPAAHWWDHIVFTRSTMNLFRSGEHIARWLAGREPGETIPVQRLSELTHAWYEDRLSPDWRPHRRDGNQAILDRLGLAGDFWRLPG